MPDPNMPDYVIEGLRAEVHRLENLVRQYRDHITQLNLTVSRMAAENYEMGKKLSTHNAEVRPRDEL